LELAKGQGRRNEQQNGRDSHLEWAIHNSIAKLQHLGKTAARGSRWSRVVMVINLKRMVKHLIVKTSLNELKALHQPKSQLLPSTARSYG
jgi:hypothetical protein